MPQRWVQNTTNQVMHVQGRALLPGEGTFVDDGPLPIQPSLLSPGDRITEAELALVVPQNVTSLPELVALAQRNGLVPGGLYAVGLALYRAVSERKFAFEPSAAFPSGELQAADLTPLSPAARLELSQGLLWRTGMVPADWSTVGAASGSVAAGTADPTLGAVLEIRATTAGTRYTAQRRVAFRSRRNAALSLWIKRDSNFSVLDVNLMAKDYTFGISSDLNKGSAGWASVDVGAWYRLVIPFSEFESQTGSPTPIDTQVISGIRVGVTPTAGNTSTLQLAGLALHEIDRPGSFTFFFDDGRLDTYTEAFRIMRQYGFVGSVAAEYHRLGTVPSYALMSLAQLQEMYAAGWDVCGHHSSNMPGLSEAAQIAIYEANRDFLRANSFERGDHIWVWPGGQRSATSESYALRYFDVTRPTGSFTLVGVAGVVDPVAPPFRYVTSSTTVSQITQHIDRVVKFGGAFTAIFHSLVTTKVAAEDFLISDFEAVCAHCAASGVQVVPASRVWLPRT